MDALLNREIKGYEIRERIGAGGFGAVYRASQPTVGREVAIKVILPQFANQPDFVRRFEVEAQVIARLEHPHIVPLYDYWRDPQGAYLVMRWLRGNLRSSLERSSWSLEAAARLLEQISAALTVAHREGIVHRDIKPDNILLDEDENAYIADFGIAKDVHLRSVASQPDDEIAGSPAYLSPEQIRSDGVTARTDLYSLGYVVYELLTGEKPFVDAKTPSDYIMKHLSDPMPMLSIRHTHIPAAVDEVLQTVTAKDPSQRYANAQRFAAAFRAALPNRLSRSVSQPLADPLTERELEVLRLMIEGLETQQIAQRLFLTLGTVRWYIKQVYNKLDAHSRQQAIERALGLKLTEPRSPTSKVDALLLNQPTVQGIEPVIRIIDPENPFKGLRAFQESDAGDFFGRALLTEQLLSRLSEGGDGVRFLTIVGPSGSGKSSVVRAGLIPALRKGALAVSPRPFIADFMPGTHPLEELEAALMRVAVNPMPGLLEQLQQDRRGLVRAAKRLLPNDNETELILVIDQFEEVFTLVTDEALRSHFIDNLLAAAGDPRGRVRIIVTLRADFYDRPLLYPRLAEVVRVNTEVIIPLSGREMEQAITAPLERVGMSAENGLTASILHDIGEQPGTLPLLQYTLTELFERREGMTLTLDAYKATGGVLGALARRAEEIYSSLDEQSQALTRQLFLRMVTLGEGTEDTRRRVLQSEFVALGNEIALDDVLNAFGQYRLLTLDRDPLTHGPTVEIAHEALIREWGRLREWLNESREEIRLQRQLMALATDWQASQKETSFLLRGARLEIFEKWSQETTLALTEQERTYLAASVTEGERQQKLEEEQQARELRLAKEAVTHQRRSTNRLRWLVTVLVLGVAASLLSMTVAISRGNEAVDARSTSDANFSEAQGLSLVNGAQLAITNGNGDLARALAVMANRVPNPSGQAQVIMSEAAYAPGTVRIFRGHFNGVFAASFSADGQQALTADIIWDVATGERIRYLDLTGITLTNNICCSLFSPDGSLVALSPNETVRIYDRPTGELLRTLTGHTENVWSMAFSPDGQTLITASNDTTLILWDVQSGAALRTFTGHELAAISVAFSPDGTRLISGSDDKMVIVWDVATGNIIHRFNEDEEVFASGGVVAYSPDGQVIAVVSNDGVLALWDARTFELLHRLEQSAFAYTLAFTHDGRRLITGEGTHTVIYDVASGRQLLNLQGHTDVIAAVAISPDDRYALTSGSDRTVRLWDLRYGAETVPSMSLPGQGMNMALSPDGASMMITSFVGSGVVGNDVILALYDSASGTEIRRFGSDGVAYRNVGSTNWRFLPIAFSLDGEHVLSSAVIVEDREIETINENGVSSVTTETYWTTHLFLWDVATGTLIREYGPLPIRVGNIDAEEVAALQFSPDGSSFAITGRDDTVSVWDTETGEMLRAFGHLDGSYSAIFSPDGRVVMAGETGGTVALWDVGSGQLIRRFGVDGNKHAIRVRALAFTADGRLAASGADDGSIILWNVESGELVRRFVGHLGAIWSLDFSTDAAMLLSASVDGDIILWDAATGEAIRRYSEHTEAVRGARFLPGGNTFVSISEDGTLRHWRIDALPDLLAWTYANRYVPELTCTERAVYRLPSGCVDEFYPTRTPYMTPLALALPTITPIIDPTVTATFALVTLGARLGDNRGEVYNGGIQRWVYHGSTGEILTIRAIADHVASSGSTNFQQNDVQDNPTLAPVIGIYQSNGVLIAFSRDIDLENLNQIIENFTLPADDDYWIEVMDYALTGGSGYTLTIEHGELPEPTTEATAEATAEVTATP